VKSQAGYLHEVQVVAGEQRGQQEEELLVEE
jgi:hypothetical protein